MENLSKVKIGISVAASWAWGTGFIVGMQTMQEKGLIPFLIWGTANIFTLVLFGILYNHGILNKSLFRKKPLKVIALVLQCIVFILNANVINNILLQVGVGSTGSYVITCLIGLILAIGMYKNGLVSSIKTDNLQMAITYICGFMLVILGTKNCVHYIVPVYNQGSIKWALWSATILLTSPIGDMEMWQRAGADRTGKAFYYGALVFSVYVFLIALCSQYKFTPVMNLVLLGMMIAVCSATLDSVVVCFHELVNKKIGTMVVCVLCVAWGVFKQMGILDLWSKIGVARVTICVSILLVGLYERVKVR